MKTSNELYRDFVIRKRLRKWYRYPIIGNVIKAINPYGMFTEDKES